jgi:hypothetical protein
MRIRHRHDLLTAAALAVLALCLAAPAEAAKAAKYRKPAAAAHSIQHRYSAFAARPRYQGGVRPGPLYNGQDYLGDDPDPNVRSYMIRDMGRYGGVD